MYIVRPDFGLLLGSQESGRLNLFAEILKTKEFVDAEAAMILHFAGMANPSAW